MASSNSETPMTENEHLSSVVSNADQYASNTDIDNSNGQLILEPSLSNPTWEYLNENYTKPNLQKHCGRLGLKGVWVTKDKLIDMILAHARSESSRDVISQAQHQDSSSVQQRLEYFIAETNSKFELVNKCLLEKDQEINDLKAKLTDAENRIQTLSQVIQSSEYTDINRQNLQPHIQEEKTLLLGDSSFREVRSVTLMNIVL